jgi:hypothetical protein
MGIRSKTRITIDRKLLRSTTKHCMCIRMYRAHARVHLRIKKCLDWFLKATFKAPSYKQKSYGLSASNVSQPIIQSFFMILS